MKLEEDNVIVLRDGEGQDVTNDTPGDGSCVSVVEVVSADGQVLQTFPRNSWGAFFHVYQPSGRWQAKRQALLAGNSERETIMV